MAKEFYFQWHITNLCNMRCQHCYQSDFTANLDLDWQAIKKVADNFLSILEKWNKYAVINLTGGEPFLKEELFKLLDYLDTHKNVKKLGIISNGSCLSKDLILRLRNYKKLREVKLSLEGPTEELNDSIRTKGAFSKTLKSIELLKPEKNLEIIIMFTLLRRNLSEITKMFNFIQENKLKGVIFERFIPWGNGKLIKAEVLTKEEWNTFISLILQYLEIPFSNEIFNYKAFWVKLEGSEFHLFGAPCTVADDGLCIMPNGDCYPCRRFNLKIGCLLNERLDQIYNGSFVLQDLKLKNNLKGKCKICLIKSCRGCRALAFAQTGDYLAEDIQCGYGD